MKSFKQFIVETVFKDKIWTNPSTNQLKAIARNNKYGSARYVVYKDGTLIAGDSEKYTHQDIAPAMGAWKARGYIQHLTGNDYSYKSFGAFDNLHKDHEHLEKFEKAGIVRG